MTQIEELIKPETELEKRIISDSDFIAGAMYGKPRPGHPEGQVIYHIAEVLANVEKYAIENDRRELRLIAIIHDTFKYKVDKSKPKAGANHHAMIARKFAEKYGLQEDILDIIELHDEAYNAWSMGAYKMKWIDAHSRLDRLLLKLTDQNFALYKKFYRCDNETGNKSQENYTWFCNYIGGQETS